MKKVKESRFSAIIFILAMLIVSACNTQPRVVVISATIERGIATSGGITQIIDGYRPARIDFMVYGFGQLPSVSDHADYQSVSRWLVDYARCYQNGVELERSFYYHYESEFKKGKQCKITAFYQVPDDGTFGGISFKFDLEGLAVIYDGEFTNNYNRKIKKYIFCDTFYSPNLSSASLT